MQKLRAVLFVLVMLFAAKAHATNCVPGAQTQCACPGGGTGVQVCSDDGSRLGVCSNCTIIQSQPMPIGLAALAGGITMMIIGGQKVPDEGPPQAWWIPTPQISPRGGSLTWTF